MSRLPPLFVICCLLSVIWFVTPLVSAQSPTPSGSFDSFFQWLTEGLSGKKVDELIRINDSSLPFTVQISSVPMSGVTPGSSSNQNQNPVLNAAGQYKTGVDIQTPISGRNDTQATDFWNDLAGLVGFGNKKADDYTTSVLPGSVEVFTDSDNDAMLRAVPMRECAVLSAGLCQANLVQAAVTPFLTPFANSNTPAPTTDVPEIFPPQVGPCGGEGGDYCTPSCLSNYWHNTDEIAAAADICFRESGGNPLAKNDGCLRGTSVDYSIGLFQINLLAHCPRSGPHYTWSPPSCTFDNENERKSCENRLMTPDGNIKSAVDIYNYGKNWCPWSTAYPKYCNKK